MVLSMDEATRLKAIADLDVARVEAMYGFATERLRIIAQTALFGLKTLALMNGGAIALLAAAAHTWGAKFISGTVLAGFISFCVSLCAVLAAVMVGYVGQNAALRTELQFAELIWRASVTAEEQSAPEGFKPRGWMWLPVWLAAISVIGFFLGTGLVVTGLATARP